MVNGLVLGQIEVALNNPHAKSSKHVSQFLLGKVRIDGSVRGQLGRLECLELVHVILNDIELGAWRKCR